MERGCRNCMWLYHMVTYIPTAPCSECLDHDKWQTTKTTRADRIRSKSDEELAEFISDQIIDRNIGVPSETWLDWLKHEATE